MANKPKRDSSPDLERRQDSLENDMTTMKWIMGFGFGLVLIVNSVFVSLVILALWWNNTLRGEVHNLGNAIRDELHQHQLDSENHHNHSP